jgi:hypothetical protein
LFGSFALVDGETGAVCPQGGGDDDSRGGWQRRCMNKCRIISTIDDNVDRTACPPDRKANGPDETAASIIIVGTAEKSGPARPSAG